MRLTMKERKRIAEATAGRYRRARKKEKTAILNEFVELTEFGRSYAAMVLRKVWRIMDYICGKRLAPVLAEIVERLERRGELKGDPEVSKKLSRMSAATIDRLLQPERKKYQLKR